MALFERWAARVEEAASARVEGMLSAIERAIGDVPGVGAVRDGEAVRISARGLGRRLLDDARLRFAVRGRR